jgi:uncharacterized membrane protein YsdA (DUF1294 family)
LLRLLALTYLGIVNLTGAVLAVVDKRSAIRRKRRIPERRFFALAWLGGGPGIYAGCLLSRHKTRHRRFMLGIPLIVGLQTALAFWLAGRG